MTHDYKAALDEINRIFYYEFPVWVSIYKEPKLSDKLMYTIRSALTIAAEYERVKKERDELRAQRDALIAAYEDDNFLDAIESAKKVSEQNGNA